MQTLKFIGRGSAFNTKEGNTSAYYKNNGNMLLIDCGESIFNKIIENKILDDVKDISVLITHLHSDHIGSLSTLIYYCKYKAKVPVNVYYPTDELDTMLKAMGHTEDDYLYLDREIDCIYNINFLARSVYHIDGHSSYGYHIGIDETDIWYSGDCSVFAWEEDELCLFDEIYQDTCLADYEGNVHLSLRKLCEEVPERYRHKVYCMHIDNDALIKKAIKEGFNVVECDDYDLTALYLYYSDYNYNVAKITKVNDKTVKLFPHILINKDDFKDRCYKLTQEEADIYKRESLKKFGGVDLKIDALLNKIKCLKEALCVSPLAEINTEKLQMELNSLSAMLQQYTLNAFEINDKQFKIDNYSSRLIEQE